MHRVLKFARNIAERLNSGLMCLPGMHKLPHMRSLRGHTRYKIKEKSFSPNRRGFTLLEVALTLVVVSIIASAAIRLYVDHLQRSSVGRTAIYMSALADDLETYVTYNFFTLRANVQSQPNSTLELAWADLINNRVIDLEAAPITPLKQELRVFLQDTGTNSIYVVLLTDGGVEGRSARFTPRPQAGSRFVGKVDISSPARLAGWDFSFDIAGIQAGADADFLNQLGVIRQISNRVDISPFLHRVEIPEQPDLTTMEGDLNMGDHNISGVNELDLETLTVTGDMTVSGALSTESLMSKGTTALTNVTLDGATIKNLVAETITSGKITAGTARVARLITPALQSTKAEVVTLSATEAKVEKLTAETGAFSALTIEELETTSIITQSLTTGSCSGC